MRWRGSASDGSAVEDGPAVEAACLPLRGVRSEGAAVQVGVLTVHSAAVLLARRRVQQMTLYERIAAACCRTSSLTVEQLEQHIRGIVKVVMEARAK